MVNLIRGFSSLVPVLHRFILKLTCVSVATSVKSDEFVTAYACWFSSFHVTLCTVFTTEHQESSLPAEQQT